ncbi:MAG: outer membrane beta-barrel protein [Agriterribacter sp.]
MKPISFFLILICMGMASISFAQQGQLSMNLNYSVNTPTGSFKSDIISKTSLRGWNAGLLYGISDHFSVGLQAGFNDYSEKYPRQVYDLKGGAISAVLTNSVQTIPIQAKVKYNLIPSGFIQPYIGAGVGGNLVTFNQYVGEFSNTSKSGFYFAASPEAGITIPFGRGAGSGLTLGANYNYMPFNYGDIKNLNNWGVFAGIKFPLK